MNDSVEHAAQYLQRGHLVVFPTETVYGIGALAHLDDAVSKIFQVKGRPLRNPLILHIADLEQLESYVKEVPECARKCIETFWPGPLTICLEKSSLVSDIVSGGLPTVCVRQPNHEFARDLIRKAGAAIAAPSANLSGRPSTTDYEDARQQLEYAGVMILDGGQTPIGLESTVIDCTRSPVRILRPGAISKKQLEECLGEEVLEELHPNQISSPGQLLEHYAPQGKLTVIMGKPEFRRQWIAERLACDAKTAVGFLGKKPDLELADLLFQLANEEHDLDLYAQKLYRFLNWCDQQGAEEIYLELPNRSHHPLFSALMNRLQKASQGKVVNLD